MFKASNIKYFKTHKGISYTADIILNGKKIGCLDNEGNGGPTNARITNEHFSAFMNQAKKTIKRSYEVDSDYCEYLLNQAEGV